MTTTNPKMNVKLTSKHGGREVLLNWNNVNFIMNVKDYSGREHTEIWFGAKSLEVKETVEEIENHI